MDQPKSILYLRLAVLPVSPPRFGAGGDFQDLDNLAVEINTTNRHPAFAPLLVQWPSS